jgi:hypothetical protein
VIHVDSSWLHDDDRFLAELGEAMRAADEVPDSFVQAGKSAFAWHDVDSELARLVSDSAAGDPAELAGAGMRSEQAEPRSLTFATAELTIEVDVQPDALRGQVVPAQGGSGQVRGRGEAVQDFPIDESGWFVIRPVPAGPYRLSIRLDSGISALTDWI